MSAIMMLEISAREVLTIVWAVVWQSTLLCGVIWLLAWMLRNAAPQIRYWLWMALAIKLLLMPLWFVRADLPPSTLLSNPSPTFAITNRNDRPLESHEARIVDASTNNPAERRTVAELLEEIGLGGTTDSTNEVVGTHSRNANRSSNIRSSSTWPWAVVLGGIWLGIVLARFVFVARQHQRIQRLVCETKSVAACWTVAAEEAAKSIGLKKSPALRATSADVSPFVWGLSRPVVILPQWMLDERTASTVRPVLLHEFAHVRRRDLLWTWVPELVRLLYWFHPVAHLIVARMRLERELSCDQVVLAHTNFDAAGYAETLVNVLSRLSRPALCRVPMTLLGLHSGAFWTRRIMMLENSGMKKLLPSRGLTFGLLIGCCVGLAVPTFVPRWLEARSKKQAPALAPTMIRQPIIVTNASHPPQDNFVAVSPSMGSPTSSIVGAADSGGASPFTAFGESVPAAGTFGPDSSFAAGVGAPGVAIPPSNESSSTLATPQPGASSPSATTKPTEELLEFLPLFSPGEQHIAKELDKPTEIAFTDTALMDAMTFLADYHSIPIIIDSSALQELGLSPDFPVTRSLTGVKLRSALKIILSPLSLTAVIQNEVLKITSMEQSEITLFTRTYPVADLCFTDGDYTNLVSAISRSSRMKNWDPESGGGGDATIVPVERASSLIVTQNYEGHEHVLDLLRMLREVKSHPRRPQAPRRNDPAMGAGLPSSGFGGMGLGGMVPMSSGTPFGQ